MLSNNSEDRLKQLEEARETLRGRLQAGVDCRAEDLLSAYPSLASDVDCAVDLVYTEFTTRKELGEEPTLSDWYQRFPQWREQLKQRFGDTDQIAESRSILPRTLPLAGSVPETPAPLFDTPPQLTLGLGRYEAYEILGSNMGTVYRAYDTKLKRVVALKTLPCGSAAQRDSLERFLREQQAGGRLKHKNIVPIYDAGDENGTYYFVMPFVGNGSLRKNRERFHDPQVVAGLVEKLARAVQYAHECGVIHRDLKSANILIDEHDEPLIADFGLAKILDADIEITPTGAVLGTPQYMAPEQADGSHTVGGQADVWALGVILYELLTGQRPFTGEGNKEILQRVLLTEPDPPRTIRSDLDPALEAVVMKCLKKDTAERYPTAQALAEALEQWQKGLLPAPCQTAPIVRARPAPRMTRLLTGARTHPLRTTAFAACAVVALVLGAWKLWSPSSTRTGNSADKPIVLIGEGAQLDSKQIHWLHGGKHCTFMPGPDGFTLKSDGIEFGLLTLLDRPPWDAYRIEAEIRQDQPGAQYSVALLWGITAAPHKNGPSHLAYVLQIKEDDIAVSGMLSLEADRFKDLPDGSIETCKDSDRNLHDGSLPKLDVKLDQDRWRTVSVEVRPTEMSIACDGEPIRTVSIEELQRLCPDWLEAARIDRNRVLSGSIGIYAAGSSATIRKLVVHPIKSEP